MPQSVGLRKKRDSSVVDRPQIPRIIKELSLIMASQDIVVRRTNWLNPEEEVGEINVSIHNGTNYEWVLAQVIALRSKGIYAEMMTNKNGCVALFADGSYIG